MPNYALCHNFTYNTVFYVILYNVLFLTASTWENPQFICTYILLYYTTPHNITVAIFILTSPP